MVRDPPLGAALKFNVNGAAKGKPRPMLVAWLLHNVLHNELGVGLVLYPKNVVLIESNEVAVVAILEALWIFSSTYFSVSSNCGKQLS